MKKVIGLVVAAVMVVAFSLAEAQPVEPKPGTAPAVPPAGMERPGLRPGPGGRPMPMPPNPAEVFQRLVVPALTAPWAKDDTQVQSLVDKVLADRKTMIESETANFADVEKLVAAVRGGDKETIQAAREAVRTSTEKVLADNRTLYQDISALRDRLREIGPQPATAGPKPLPPEQPKPAPDAPLDIK